MKIFSKIKSSTVRCSLFIILTIAFFFRFYGLNWDQGTHLHPDERFLTMVLTSMKIPKSIGDYLNPKISTMNPYNIGYNFFVYGTFPLNLTKLIGVFTANNDYGTIHIVGRILSAFFDLGTVYLVYLISKKLLNKNLPITNHPARHASQGETGRQSLITPLLAAFLYSIMVLPIQLSHFFAVDTFLNFFLVLSFYFLINLISSSKTDHSYSSSYSYSAALGGSFGTALACKISALLFLPIILLGLLFSFIPSKIVPGQVLSWKDFKIRIVCFIFFIIIAYLSFRTGQPQAFADANFLNLTPNPQFVKNLKELKQMSSPQSWIPPNVQWQKTTPIIFPLKNHVLWGLGLPLGIICLASVFSSISQLLYLTVVYIRKRANYLITRKIKFFLITNYQLLITLWILLLFIYQGIQFGKTMRYFLPIYPFLALLSAQFVVKLSEIIKKKSPSFFLIFYFLFFILILVYPISFMSIYTKPITRVTASEWIYGNIPAGSTLLNEEWDDGLPLSLGRNNASIYDWQTVFMYDADTPEKWQRTNQKLATTDYIIITSNRAYGATMKMPERYPQTINYYQSLFKGTGDFKKIAEFTSYPCFPPGKFNLFCFNDDTAEEAFTVYDHPKVLIFQKE